MHITKQPSTMKRYTQLLAIGGMISSLSAFASAHEGHDQMMQMDQSVQQNILMETSSPVDHSGHQPETKQVPSDIQHDAHDHHREHGGQIYCSITKSIHAAFLVFHPLGCFNGGRTFTAGFLVFFQFTCSIGYFRFT